MQRAADNGDEDAPPLIEKFSKAAEALKKVDSGDPQAQTDLGDALMYIARSLSQGGESEEDMKLGFDLLTKASAQGIGHALWLLGLSYQHGRGTEQDMQKALETYGKGAELGHAPCIYMLACFCLTDENADEERKKKGFALCKEAAEKAMEPPCNPSVDAMKTAMAANGIGKNPSHGIKGLTKSCMTKVSWSIST